MHSARALYFQASLAQAEELWDAAALTSPASRPLPLFHALSQASRAICAAWICEGPWQAKQHGLAIEEPPRDAPLQIPLAVADSRLGTFALLAQATGSPVFEGKVTLGELWASLPHFPYYDRIVGDAARPLRLYPPRQTPGPQVQLLRQGFFPDLAEPDAVDLDAVLAQYPTVRRFEKVGVEKFGWFEYPLLSFPEEGQPRLLAEVGDPTRIDDSSTLLCVHRWAWDPRRRPRNFSPCSLSCSRSPNSRGTTLACGFAYSTLIDPRSPSRLNTDSRSHFAEHRS